MILHICMRWIKCRIQNNVSEKLFRAFYWKSTERENGQTIFQRICFRVTFRESHFKFSKTPLLNPFHRLNRIPRLCSYQHQFHRWMIVYFQQNDQRDKQSCIDKQSEDLRFEQIVNLLFQASSSFSFEIVYF